MKNSSKPHYLSKQQRKILLIMSNAFIVFFLLTISVSASVLGQRVSIDMSDATLEECIQAIESQTDLGFFYKVRQVRKVDGISITAYDEMVDDVLDELLAGTALTYQLSKGVILIKPKPAVRRTPKPLLNEPAEVSIAAPQKIVNGTVTDEEGLSLPGATVRVKGTNNGVAADENGKFEIEVKDNNAVLVFSFLGYETLEVPVGSSSTIDVSLVLALNELEEAVVIGYGTSKKKDLTGSVVRISEKAFEASSYTDMGSILQGQVSGMEVISGSGRPGEQVRIRIRGESSLLGDANPLIVIDEIPMPDDYDLNLINPNDIKNIDVLKGASAAAIYGSKGSAGVVLITTKQGGQGNAEVFYNGNISTQGYVEKMQALGGDDFRKLMLQSLLGSASWYEGYYGRIGRTILDIRTNPGLRQMIPGFVDNGDTDWMDAMTETPFNMNHSLGIRGGNKEASYYASFGYTKDKGRVVGNANDRLTALLSMDLRPTSWFEMGFRMNGAKSNTTTGQDVNAVMQARPDAPVFDESGDYYRYYSTGHKRYRDNPLQLSLEAPRVNNSLNYTVTGYGRILFTKDLRYQVTASYSETKGDNRYYQPSYTYNGSGGYYGGVSGVLSSGTSYSSQANIDNALYYTKTTEKHDISLMVGTTFNQDKAGYESSQFQDFPDDYIQNVSYNATKWNYSSGSDDASAYFSIYSRANYKYMDRYLFTGTLRRDASSKFAPDYRAGIFPSAALAWVLSEEEFLKYNPVQLSFLKLRLGYGVTGNNRIGRYAWRSGFGSTQYFDQPGTYPTSIGNDEVRWEETVQIDVGLDFGFWNNRILGTLGWYSKDTDGLLFGYSLAPSAGLTSITMNFAEIENSGLEFDIRAQVLESEKWQLSFGFNIANNKGKVVKLSKAVVGDAYGNDPGYYATTVLREGDPVGLIYGYVWDDTQFDSDGSYMWVDLNDDGAINEDYDRDVIGSSVPDFFGGFNVDLRYRNFTSRLVGKYSYGAQKHWTGLQNQFHANAYNPDNVMDLALYAYSPNNPDSRFQAFSSGWEKYISSNYVFDASYLKLADMMIGYDLPKSWVEKIGLSNVNFYGAINNLFTLTTYPGTNVEAYSSNPIEGAGQDYSIYPRIRTFTLGLKAMLR